MWAKAFPTHNAQARAAGADERAKREAAVSAERRLAAATNERWKEEVEGALADARRGHARARLHQALRDGLMYVSQGMRVGVSGVAPLGVLINWTNRVADDLDLLGINAVQSRVRRQPSSRRRVCDSRLRYRQSSIGVSMFSNISLTNGLCDPTGLA